MSSGKVAVLMGGPSAEREISLISGRAVLEALRSKDVDAHAFDPAERPLFDLQQEGYERVFIALHGRFGEDGTVQGALEVMRIPYTGSGVMASALAMDKWRTKLVWHAAGIPTPRFAMVDRSTEWDKVADLLGLPVIVKPSREGSTIGLTKVKRVADLREAYELAARYDDLVLAEEFVAGKEVTASILGGVALPLVRIEAPQGNYDYQHKYFTDETKYYCPAGLRRAPRGRDPRRGPALVPRARLPRMGARGRDGAPGRELQLPRIEHRAGHDGAQPRADRRARGGDRLRRALRAHPRRGEARLAGAGMSAAPALRSRILPAVAATAVIAALACGGWYGYRALAARPIAHVELAGDVARIPPAELDTFARSLKGLAVGTVSLAAVREAARRLPWVRDAAVRRRFPDGIEVTFDAHRALARWGANALVSTRGEVFSAQYDAKLPSFQGPDGSAAAMAQEYTAIAPMLAPLASPIAELRLSARGAWHATLESGLTLELGRGDVGPRIQRFVAAWPGLAARGVETRHADLRYANGFALRVASSSKPAPHGAANPRKPQPKKK